jgi:hypothetical protein
MGRLDYGVGYGKFHLRKQTKTDAGKSGVRLGCDNFLKGIRTTLSGSRTSLGQRNGVGPASGFGKRQIIPL